MLTANSIFKQKKVTHFFVNTLMKNGLHQTQHIKMDFASAKGIDHFWVHSDKMRYHVLKPNAVQKFLECHITPFYRFQC